jgi:2,3-bisphosphoglycerate-dependent phosphoglycerate mutase
MTFAEGGTVVGVPGSFSRLIFVRHGQSTDNAEGVFGNRAPGAGLTDTGRRQAHAAAERLRARSVAAVYSSEARRAIETAGIVAAAMGLPAEAEPGLLEYDFGVHEGSSDPRVGRLSFEALERWLRHGDLTASMEGGESGTAVVTRFEEAVARIAHRHADETVVIVGHAGTLAVGLLHLCANLTAGDVWGKPLGHGRSIIVDRSGGG